MWDKAEPLNLGGSSSEIGRQESYIVNEAGVNIHLDHPNIVKLYDMHTGTFHVYLFFEYVAGEDLIDFITRQKSKRLSEKKARSIFRKLVSALGMLRFSSVEEFFLLTHQLRIRSPQSHRS